MEDLIAAPCHSLIHQSLHAEEAKTGTNGDGFGVGWYGARPEPGLYREVRPAWSDENLRSICAQVRSPLFFAHVRAATGTATTRANCHPFVHGRWMFMHNGQIGGYGAVRRALEQLIPDDLYTARAGTTDSEALFLAGAGDRGWPRTPSRRLARALAAAKGADAQGRHRRAAALHRGAARTARISTPSAGPATPGRRRSTIGSTRVRWWSCRSRWTGRRPDGRKCRAPARWWRSRVSRSCSTAWTRQCSARLPDALRQASFCATTARSERRSLANWRMPSASFSVAIASSLSAKRKAVSSVATWSAPSRRGGRRRRACAAACPRRAASSSSSAGRDRQPVAAGQRLDLAGVAEGRAHHHRLVAVALVVGVDPAHREHARILLRP